MSFPAPALFVLNTWVCAPCHLDFEWRYSWIRLIWFTEKILQAEPNTCVIHLPSHSLLQFVCYFMGFFLFCFVLFSCLGQAGRAWCSVCPFMIYGELVQSIRRQFGPPLRVWPKVKQSSFFLLLLFWPTGSVTLRLILRCVCHKTRWFITHRAEASFTEPGRSSPCLRWFSCGRSCGTLRTRHIYRDGCCSSSHSEPWSAQRSFNEGRLCLIELKVNFWKKSTETTSIDFEEEPFYLFIYFLRCIPACNFF